VSETPPNTRRRKWRLLLLLMLLAAAALGVGRWWTARQDLSDAERQIVGTWEYQWDGNPTKLPLAYEFRPDRTCRVRNYDPKTGALLAETTSQTWWRSGNKLIVRHPDSAAVHFWHVLPSQRSADEVSILTPDGPDRFRFTGTIEIRGTPTQPSVSGTMTRVTPTENRQH
jgi:hypothetical protein